MTRYLIPLFLLLGSVLSAQDTLDVTVSSTPTEIAYADIIVVRANAAGKAVIFYGANYNAVTTDETYEVVTGYTPCGLIPFTERTTGVRLAVPTENIDTVLKQASYAQISVQPVFAVAPTSYATGESYASVFASVYDCGSQGAAVTEGANIGYGVGLFLDKDRQTLRFKTLVPGDNITLDQAATTVTINSSGGGVGGATNLAYTASATNGVVTSDTGTDATIPAGSTTNASLMLPADKTKLNGIEPGATADQTDNEIATAYGNVIGQVSGGEITAGTVTSLRTYSPADIKAFVDTHGGGGGGSVATFLQLTSGPAIFNLAYTGSSAPTLATAGTGTYTITAPAGTHVSWVNAKATTATLTGSNEFIFKFDNSANTFTRRLSVEYNSNSGSLIDPFTFGMNYTQTVAADVTTITVPNGNALGSSGFWLLMN